MGDLALALSLYSSAISLDPSNPLLPSNRSLAHARNGDAQLALDDARRAVSLDPSYLKAYLREGAALSLLGRHEEAAEAYAAALERGVGEEGERAQLDKMRREASERAREEAACNREWMKELADRVPASPFYERAVEEGEEVMSEYRVALQRSIDSMREEGPLMIRLKEVSKDWL